MLVSSKPSLHLGRVMLWGDSCSGGWLFLREAEATDGPRRAQGRGVGFASFLQTQAGFGTGRTRGGSCSDGWLFLQEAEPRMWTYVYPAKYSDIKTEDERWKEERDRKLKEERNRSKEASSKEDGKESTSSECKLTPTEEARMVGKDPRPSVHVPVSSPLTQHQSYIPYMHGYSYSQSYDPNHPSYRAMPTVMMQNYPGREPGASRGVCSHLSLLSGWGMAVGHPHTQAEPHAPTVLPEYSQCPDCYSSPRIIPTLQLFLLSVWEQGVRQR